MLKKTWKSGVRDEVALRLQLLDQLLERQVLVRVGAERRLAHPAQQLAEARAAPARSVRSTRVLTKKPISPSISARPRPAIGEPTDDVVLAGEAASRSLKPARRVMNRRRPCAPAESAAAAPVSSGRQDQASAGRRGRSAPAAAAGRCGSSSSGGAPASRSRQ